MSKVYIVHGEVYDPADGRMVGSAVEGVFDSIEKAVEDVKKNYGDDYCDYYEGIDYRSYKYDTEESDVLISIVEWNVNKSIWEDLA